MGGKIKAAVAEYTGPSGYAKADKPTMKSHDAASGNARAAGKFADNMQGYTRGELQEIKFATVGLEERIHGEYSFRPKWIGDDRIRALLQDALNDPKFNARMKADIEGALGRMHVKKPNDL